MDDFGGATQGTFGSLYKFIDPAGKIMRTPLSRCVRVAWPGRAARAMPCCRRLAVTNGGAGTWKLASIICLIVGGPRLS